MTALTNLYKAQQVFIAYYIAPGTAFGSVCELLFFLEIDVFYCKMFAVYDIAKLFVVGLKCVYDF